MTILTWISLQTCLNGSGDKYNSFMHNVNREYPRGEMKKVASHLPERVGHVD